MKIFKKWQTYLILGIIGFLGFCAVPKCTEVTEHRYNKPIPLPKVKESKKPYVKPEVKPNIPVKEKRVYVKKDTALRKEVEKKDIILDVKIEDNHIIETVIDTSGQVTELVIDAPVKVDEVKEIIIVPEGVEGKDKTGAGKIIESIRIHAKNGLIILGGAAIVTATAVLGAPIVAVVAVGVATGALVYVIIKTDK